MYDFPEWYDIGYRWNTEQECDFLTAVFARDARRSVRRVVDIGCGSGRHLMALARRGYHGVGCDVNEAMVRFARERAASLRLPVRFFCGDLRRLGLSGMFDAAFCLMDTLRYAVTDEELADHFTTVARCVAPGGLYVVDCWMPNDERRIGRESYDWEQTVDEVTVQVAYRQHPESLDWTRRTFEDELAFEVRQDERRTCIDGGRVTTRFFLVAEWTAFCHRLKDFELVEQFAGFDLEQPYHVPSQSWRMVTVLRRR